MRDSAQFSLRDSLNVFYRHSTLFKTIMLVLPLSTLAACLVASPVYESMARIMITAKKETSMLLQNPSIAGTSLNVDLNVDERDLNSEMEILTSRHLWNSTVKSLGLGFFEYPRQGSIGTVIEGLTRGVTGILRLPQQAQDSARKERIRTMEVVDYLLKNFKVNVASKSKSLDLSLRYPDPVKASTIMRELVKRYVPYHVEVYSLPGAEAFFGKQVKANKEKLDGAIEELTQFNKQAGLFLPERQKTALIALEEKTRQALIDVNSNLVQYDEMLSSFSKGHLPSGQLAPSTERGSENTFITILASQLLQAEQKSWQSHETYSPGARDSRLTSGLLKELRDRFEEAIRVEREVILAKKESLEKSRAELERRLEELQESSEHAKRLELVITISKDRYLQYLSKEEEARIENLKGGNKLLSVAVLGTPTEPIDPVFPKTTLYVLAAFLMAFPIGLTVVMLADFFDHGIYTPSRLEQITGLPVLTSMDKRARSPLEKFRSSA